MYSLASVFLSATVFMFAHEEHRIVVGFLFLTITLLCILGGTLSRVAVWQSARDGYLPDEFRRLPAFCSSLSTPRKVVGIAIILFAFFSFLPIAKTVTKLAIGLSEGALWIFLSFMSDVLFIILTRWMLRQAAQMNRSLPIIGVIGINYVLAAALVVFPLYFGQAFASKNESLSSFLLFLGFANFIDVLICAALLALLTIVVSHRLMWPLLARPFYGCSRYKLIQNKKLLLGLGIAFIIGPDKDVALGRWLLHAISGLHG